MVIRFYRVYQCQCVSIPRSLETGNSYYYIEYNFVSKIIANTVRQNVKRPKSHFVIKLWNKLLFYRLFGLLWPCIKAVSKNFLMICRLPFHAFHFRSYFKLKINKKIVVVYFFLKENKQYSTEEYPLLRRGIHELRWQNFEDF